MPSEHLESAARRNSFRVEAVYGQRDHSRLLARCRVEPAALVRVRGACRTWSAVPAPEEAQPEFATSVELLHDRLRGLGRIDQDKKESMVLRPVVKDDGPRQP